MLVVAPIAVAETKTVAVVFVVPPVAVKWPFAAVLFAFVVEMLVAAAQSVAVPPSFVVAAEEFVAAQLAVVVAEYILLVVSPFDFAKQLSVAAPFVAQSEVAVVAPSMVLAAGLFDVPAAVVPTSLPCSALVIQTFVANKLAVAAVAESDADIVPLGVVVLMPDAAVSQLAVGVCLQVVVCTLAVVDHFAVGWSLFAVSAVAMGYMAAEKHCNVAAVHAEPPGFFLHVVAVVTKLPFVEHGPLAVETTLSGAAVLYLPAFVVLVAECSVAMFRAILTSPAVASEL